MIRIKPIHIFLFVLISNLALINLKLEETVYTLEFDNNEWSYDSTNKVYYQIGVVYCTNPIDTDYQSLGIFVPEEYLKCSESSGKYSCSINSSGKKGQYTAKNAPYVLPLNTPGYSAMKAPQQYNYKTISNYISKGIIYIYAGCRGRYEQTDKDKENFVAGAPWGVTDLKSAIRFLRYNSELLPGDLNRFYSFGMSGGGAQSCLMGITGNSELFTKYLEENGAAMKDKNGNIIKDNIKGSQCWCPITNLDTADAAYEWNIGQYLSTDTREEGKFTKEVSNDLVSEFVNYINKLKLKDENGKELTLTDTNSGTYYDYLLKIIQDSLNNFISDTTFPYEKKDVSPFPPGKIRRLSTIYETIEEYIENLNSDSETPWVIYDSSKKKATVTSVKDFIVHCKSKNVKKVGAFDDFSKQQAENQLFGVDKTNYQKHFDRILAELLTKNKDKYSSLNNWDDNYPTEYTSDLTLSDSLSSTIEERVNMYNPMYYLNSYYKGYKTSDIAEYFRINTGIAQVDTGNVVEMDLYLALINNNKSAEFTTVWDKEHVEAERTGTSEENFISWVNKIEEVDKKGYNKYINYNCLLLGLFLLLL